MIIVETSHVVGMLTSSKLHGYLRLLIILTITLSSLLMYFFVTLPPSQSMVSVAKKNSTQKIEARMNKITQSKSRSMFNILYFIANRIRSDTTCV